MTSNFRAVSPRRYAALCSLALGLLLAGVLSPATPSAGLVLTLLWAGPILFAATLGWKPAVACALIGGAGIYARATGDFGSVGGWMESGLPEKWLLLSCFAILGHTSFRPDKNNGIAFDGGLIPPTRQSFEWHFEAGANADRLLDPDPVALAKENTLEPPAQIDILRRATHELSRRATDSLGAVRASMEILSHRVGRNADVERFASLAESELDRLQSAMALYAELTAPPAVTRQPQSVNDAVGRAARRFEANPRNVKVRWKPHPAQPTAHLTGPAMERAAVELLQNAIEASAQGANVDVDVTQSSTHAIVAVRDRGAGIPVSIRDRVFHPFVTTKAGAMGMGLAICHKLLQDCGGNLAFQSTAGEGSTFKLLIPLAVQPDRPGAPEPRPSGHVRRPEQ